MIWSKRITWFVLPTFLLVIIITVLHTSQTNAEKVPNGPEDIAKRYINYMETGEYQNILNLFANGSLGILPSSNETTLEETEKTNLFLNGSIDSLSLLKQQREYVVSLFGQNAWSNASFTLESVNAPETTEKWIQKSTGEEVSEEEGRKLLRSYWDEVGRKEGINPADLFNNLPLVNGEIKDSKLLKLKDIKDTYTKGEPIEILLVGLYETYKVNLKYHNQIATQTGEHDFHFYITNKNGKWIIYDGLQWNAPLTESQGDI